MALKFLKLDSLRSRLVLLVALAIAPSAVMTIYTGWKEHQNTIAATQENLQRLTNLASINEAHSIHSAQQLLRDLSDVPELLGGETQCNALMKRVLAKNPAYANLGLIELNGNVSCSAVPSKNLVNLADRAHFKRAVAERRFIAGNYVFGRVIQKHTINLTYPVIAENGDVLAVVFAALDLVALDQFVAGINLPAGSILITADSQGNIISRRPDPEKWFGRPVSAEMLKHMAEDNPAPIVLTGPDEIERLHTFARVGDRETSDYALTIGIPTENIVAAAQHDQFISLVTLGITTLLALLATWLVGSAMIVTRVKALVQTSQKIAAGDLQARSNIKYGKEEIGTLAQALDEMACILQRKDADRDIAEEKLRATDSRKDQFLAMLAHELRNPLAPISAAAHLIRTVKFGDEAKLKQASDIIIRQVSHMAGLVDDLIDVSRVTRGLVTTDKKPQDLKIVLSDAMEQVEPLIKQQRLHLVVDLPKEPTFVLGDHKRLVQIVTNLLHNAAKYTKEGGNILLELKVEDAETVITISDDGIGMSAELLPRVFDLFTQAERTPDRSQGGLGIGLALVKRIVALLEGSVTAYSKGVGMGSKFEIRLPSLDHDKQLAKVAASTSDVQASVPAAVPAHAPVQKPASPSAASPLRILVVEDNIDAAHSLAMFLEEKGYQVSVEHTSVRALERARIEMPDICLLDIGLPDFDGYELARRLREQPESAHALLIAATGYDRRQHPQASPDEFDHYYIKPIDTEKLADLLADFSRPEEQETPAAP